MCLSCGCGKIDDDMGDDRTITMSDVRQAADSAGTSVEQVVQNIAKGVHDAQLAEKR